MAGYNRTREVEQLLQKTQSSPPSFVVHLHAEYWILNNGSKFLYNNQIASLLDDIRAHRIPVDFLDLFDQTQVPFYDGCMVVELLDYRSQRSQEAAPPVPEKTRVVLHPNPQTLWADICILNQRNGGKWTDRDALEVEAKLLLATSPPLCLDPDPHLTRIVNHVVRVSTPSSPASLKRKATTMEPEENGPEKAKRERLMAFMAPRDHRHAPSYRLLDTFLASKKNAGNAAAMQPVPVPTEQYTSTQPQLPQLPPQTTPQPPPQQPPPALAPPTPAPPPSQSHSPADMTDNKTQKLVKKINTPQIPQYSVAFTQSNGSHTPVPPQPTPHQFVNQHPPAVQATPSLQPQVYPTFQAATEAAKRAATPAQPHHPPQQPIQFQQQYMQYQAQQHSQQQQTQQQHPQQPQQSQPQPQQQRPPSQPQIVPQHQPQPTAQQQMQPPQQAYAQSPKTPAPVNATSPARTQPTPQPYNNNAPAQFQPQIPTPNFLQPPPNTRVAVKPQGIAPNQQQQPQPVPSQMGSHPSQAPFQQQLLYSQQLQQSQHQLQQQQAQMLLQQQQRMGIANAQKNGGGRVTPQVQSMQMQQNHSQGQGQGQGQMQMSMQGPVQQQGQSQLQPPQQPPQSTASPSPVRNSPMVTHQQLQAAAAARASPMPAKAQILQQGQSQQPQSQIAQQHGLAPQGGQMQGTRVQFQAPYNPSQLRPNMVHGTPQQTHMMLPPAAPTGTPTMAAASPRMNGRPVTPAIALLGPDGKPQQQGQQVGMQIPVQPPMRRPTPLQQQQMQVQQQQRAMSPQVQHATQAQMQAQAQAQAQAQLQAQQQHQGIQQQQQPQMQMQAQAQSPQNPAQTPIQQPAQLPQQQQQQQMTQAQYAQMYNYQQQYQSMQNYWRANMTNATPQQLQRMQQLMQQQQQQLAQQQQLQQQQPQQSQQHIVPSGQNMMANGAHQTAVPVGMSMQNPAMTPQQAAMMKAMAMHHQQQQHQQAAMSLGGGGGGPSGHVQPPQQPTMIAKMMPTQTPAQMQAQAAMGKGKAGPKKGATAKKGPPR